VSEYVLAVSRSRCWQFFQLRSRNEMRSFFRFYGALF
jgi:hypothetical protein